MSFDFILDDWKKIPPGTKYIFGLGFLFIFLVWLVDHWGASKVYTLFGWDFRNVFFNIGTVVFLFGFFMLASGQVISFGKAQYYRRKYPLKALNTNFYLVWFSGKLYLFDVEEKKYFHIYPWETAQDLFFTHVGTKVEGDVSDTESPRVLLNHGDTLLISDYSNGGVITTRLS